MLAKEWCEISVELALLQLGTVCVKHLEPESACSKFPVKHWSCHLSFSAVLLIFVNPYDSLSCFRNFTLKLQINAKCYTIKKNLNRERNRLIWSSIELQTAKPSLFHETTFRVQSTIACIASCLASLWTGLHLEIIRFRTVVKSTPAHSIFCTSYPCLSLNVTFCQLISAYL